MDIKICWLVEHNEIRQVAGDADAIDGIVQHICKDHNLHITDVGIWHYIENNCTDMGENEALVVPVANRDEPDGKSVIRITRFRVR